LPSLLLREDAPSALGRQLSNSPAQSPVRFLAPGSSEILVSAVLPLWVVGPVPEGTFTTPNFAMPKCGKWAKCTDPSWHTSDTRPPCSPK
jgi:hypothetical protein